MPAVETSLVDRVRQIAVLLIDPERPAYSLRSEVLELKSIYVRASGGALTDADDIATGQTNTASGVAISPTMASMCVDDFARTVQFIRGTHDAIRDIRKQIKDRPIQVLYAGCGPWAALAVPLMTVFDAEAAVFTLLDIHSASVESAKTLVDALGLSDRVVTFEAADAATYSMDSIRPDIVLIEMMRAGLEAEPQVAVSRNLTRQAPDAVLIPEVIRIDLSLVNAAREFSMGDSVDVAGEVGRDRVSIGPVIVVEKGTLNTSDVGGPIITLPVFDEMRYQPMLLTTVKIYGENLLQDYDSGITLPKSLPISTKLRSGDKIRFDYELGSRPRVTAELLPHR